MCGFRTRSSLWRKNCCALHAIVSRAPFSLLHLRDSPAPLPIKKPARTSYDSYDSYGAVALASPQPPQGEPQSHARAPRGSSTAAAATPASAEP